MQLGTPGALAGPLTSPPDQVLNSCTAESPEGDAGIVLPANLSRGPWTLCRALEDPAGSAWRRSQLRHTVDPRHRRNRRPDPCRPARRGPEAAPTASVTTGGGPGRAATWRGLWGRAFNRHERASALRSPSRLPTVLHHLLAQAGGFPGRSLGCFICNISGLLHKWQGSNSTLHESPYIKGSRTRQ